jgi:hypothetical protein
MVDPRRTRVGLSELEVDLSRLKLVSSLAVGRTTNGFSFLSLALRFPDGIPVFWIGGVGEKRAGHSDVKVLLIRTTYPCFFSNFTCQMFLCNVTADVCRCPTIGIHRRSIPM